MSEPLDLMFDIFNIEGIDSNMRSTMPFKEKVAWISVITTILVWGSYFGFMAATGGRMPGPVYLTGFVGAVIVQVILIIIASIVTAVLAPSDAGAASDERDKTVARRAYA